MTENPIKKILRINHLSGLIFDFLCSKESKSFSKSSKCLSSSFRLNIKNINLSDKLQRNIIIEDFVKNYPFIKAIDLSCNNLKNIQFFALEQFKGIESIDLSQNQDINDYTPLTNLQAVKFLDISYNNIKNIDFLLSNTFQNFLESLILIRCNSIEDYSPLSKMKELKTLNLSYHEYLKNINFLTSLVNLVSLNLASAKSISDYTPLLNLKKIKYLNLSRNNLLNDLNFLDEGKFENLEIIELSENRNIDISPLFSYKKLIGLNLVGINLRGISFSKNNEGFIEFRNIDNFNHYI